MRDFCCPACGKVVRLPEHTEGERAVCPSCGEDVRWARPVRRKHAVRLRHLVLLAIAAISLALLLFFIGLERHDQRGRVVCFPVGADGWTFECQVTGKGEAKGDETFSPAFIDIALRQGNDLNRTYRGTRWYARVKVEEAARGASVEPGRTYELYGTVTHIDGNRVQLTDCVFTAVPAKP